LSAWSMLLSRTMICKALAPCGKFEARVIAEGVLPVYPRKLTLHRLGRLPA
jgi:hypothetical protein